MPTIAALLAVLAVGAEQTTPLLSLASTAGTRLGFGDRNAPATLEVVTGEGKTTDGDGALRLAARATTAEGNQYWSVLVPLAEPVDLTGKRVLLDARTDDPGRTAAFYVRFYNRGEGKPAWSFQTWSQLLRDEWQTFEFQTGYCAQGLGWEPDVVEQRVATQVDRIELIIGTSEKEVPFSGVFDNVRTAPPLKTVKDLEAPKPLVRETVLVRGGQPLAVALHPDSDAGRQAGAAVVAAVKAQTGATLEARAATPADQQPGQAAILLGSEESNPALRVLYARFRTPVDPVCPGPGGALVHTVPDPFGQGVGAVVVGASDDAGLARAAELFGRVVAAQPKAGDLVLGKVFERAYAPEFLKRFGWANSPPDPQRVSKGLEAGKQILERGDHTSIAGLLQNVALRYQLTGNPEEATLFAALWDLYTQSAVADPRKYGGPWGFDSDFPSLQVVCGWAGIEYDPVLTDAERLAVTRSMARWLAEAVVPKCMGAVTGSVVPHNHQTFPGLGTLAAGLYFTQGWDCAEGRTWLAAADKMFRRQAGYFKPYEDCNGYQWLSNGHLFRYAMARPDYGVFENGNSKRIIDYCIGTMNPLGYQVPYGDTGSWQCWNSEMTVLDMFSLATGDPAAIWAAGYKRQVKGTAELYSFYRPAGGEVPQGYTGVQVWPLEPAYYETFRPKGGPALERCFDKITFRGAMDPAAPYLLLDGLSNGGHRHLDGNSIPQITQFGRIWLADNDYFKAQVKYHNSLLVFQDGQSADIPPYAELLGAGSTGKYAYCRTRLADYAGVDWDRAVVWLRQQGGFVVLDRLTAKQDSEYQLRLLWHGVGEATLNADGMLLRQKGPSMRIQTVAGPELRLTDDTDLGTNWAGYPYADPVVHSLGAVATVNLKAGATYLYATAIHGQADGDAPAWHLDLVDGIESVLIQTDQGPIAVGLGPVDAPTPAGNFTSDAEAMVVDPQGVTFLGCRKAALGELTAHQSPEPACAFVPFPDVEMALQNAPLRAPQANLAPAGEAPAHGVEWEVRPAPERLILSGNKGLPAAVDLGAKLTSEPAPAEHNAFDAGSLNRPEQLLDGQFGNSTHTSVMYEPDRPVTLTLDLGAVCRVKAVRWHQWWSTTSSKNTKYLLAKATVSASRDNFAADVQALGTVTDAGPHPNFGAPLEYRVDAPGGGVEARYVRWVIEPQPGSAVYLAELLVEGTPSDPAVQAAPYHFKRLRPAHLAGQDQPAEWLAATAEGVLLALKPDGSLRWRVEFPQAVNDVAAANFDRDGRDEVLVARQDNRATLLDADGRERWTRELQYYRRPPYANVARAGDLDGDGVPEAIIGGENWRFYAFRADGTELWNYESVHPSRSGAVADLDGDGRCEVLCGTHYYWSSTLKADGTLLWGYSLGPICYDIATGSFDHDKTRGVVYGGGDGLLHYVDPQGKPRLRYNTGDEVRHVATGDLDGDGADEIVAGSMNFSVYCFGADGKRRWRHDLGDEVTALAVVGTTVVAGTAGGKVFSFDAAGSPLALSKLGAAVVDVATDGTAALVATADGKLRRVAAR